MSTLYIRLPSQSSAASAAHWLELECPFALVPHGGAVEREGVAPLSSLAETVAKMQRVVLLLAGSDVTVLRMQVPPLSAARLKAALPNLVEEQLLCDPDGCVIVAGGLSDGLRTIAVVQRAWLDLLTSTFIAFGARHIAALPAQSCLNYQFDKSGLSDKSGQSGQPGMVTAAIIQRGHDIDLTLRFPEQDGIGLALNVEPDGTAAHEVIQTLCAVVPAAPVTLYVPQAAMRAYQEAVADTLALKERISISADNWAHWIAGARNVALNLMAGQGANTGPSLDWRSWRWPLALGAAVLLINASALNIDWWRMKSEAASLRSSMIQTYKSAYPNESVIIDPIAQMQQKIAAAKRNSGSPAPDDFTAIAATFGEAWASVTVTLATPPSIAALEYRERSLLVRLKPVLSRVEANGSESVTQQMKAALVGRGLSLELAPAQPGAVAWQIRSVK